MPRHKNRTILLVVPWWKRFVLLYLQNNIKLKKLGLIQEKRIFGLCESNWETSHRRTQWMLWCCLSIVYCELLSASPCVTPQHIPSTITGKKHRANQWIPHSSCFQTYPTIEQLVWPWPALPGRWDETLCENSGRKRRCGEACPKTPKVVGPYKDIYLIIKNNNSLLFISSADWSDPIKLLGLLSQSSHNPRSLQKGRNEQQQS